ncbi:17-beta-hydroxysteroid dehydrogenase type 1 isoform X2 [Alligator mississippiensis]|uniref:17-beta-hydroxysteroid dehydrogenase type 1 isoform X2 n=1 Tax=Alligator mississippiensis TaxID=8496 RepID=UPI000711E0B5|nr:17-beta-hydroxysteroid dehydrogenase type 1 isoform X2 [Alligator mississippiensis]
MEKTVVLITGCSSGIGLGLAVRLASDSSQRFKVFATMRDLAKKERLLECVQGCHRDTLEILQLDVTNPASVASAIQRVPEQHVDVLVCNAGVGLMGPLETCSQEAIKVVFDVNLFGTINTIQAFLPGMKCRKAGKIIITSSVGALQGVPFNAVYCASKFAVEGLCESLAIVLQEFNIHITLIECGPVNTSFLSNMQSMDPEGHELQGLDPKTYALYCQYFQHCQSLFQDAAQDTDEVFLDAICTPNPPLRCFTTQFFMPLTRLKLLSPDGSEYVQAMHKFVFSTSEPQGDQA